MEGPNFSLHDKVAIVTGGRRGIGKAIALAFAGAGADVAVCDYVVEDGELKAVAEGIQKLGRRSLAVKADISRKTDVENLVQRVIDKFGQIDILVNNAGITARASLLELRENEWDRVVNTNLKGYYLCCQAVSKKMVEKREGNIISIASVVGISAIAGAARADILKAVPEACAYFVSKAGVIMLTKRLAWELASLNIRVNAIAPGLVLTEMSSAWENPEKQRQLSASVPLGRMAQPEDIAGAALFLASDASSYITGHTIVVDGGLLA
jgi:3-oxoacyl-[acyl-carrier protein] reductase